MALWSAAFTLFFLSLNLITAFGAESSPIESTEDTVQTLLDRNGVEHRFTRVTEGIPPEMGDSWKDEKAGLIWGDFLKNKDGEIDLMTQKSAKRKCEALGARLPTNQEVYALIGKMTKSNRVLPEKDYTPEILPNFSTSRLEAEVEDLFLPILWLTLDSYKIAKSLKNDGPLFWTGTEQLQYKYIYGYYCNATRGEVRREVPRFRGAGARCVIEIQPKAKPSR